MSLDLIAYPQLSCIPGRCQDLIRVETVAFLGGALKKRKLLELHMVLGLRFGAGAATSGAGAGAPAAPALATDL